MKFAVAIASVLLATVSVPALAADEANHTIQAVGVQGLGFVQFKESLSQPCKFSTIYLPDLSQFNARGMLAVLLSAQANGSQVSVAYDIDASGFCSATKVQVQ